MDYFLLIVGLATLIFSGEFLVRGAVNFAVSKKISKLVIAMTIVSFGTSAPELLISIKAALDGHPDISIGNVVGSNIANISFILGIVALFSAVKININTLKIDWPALLISTMLLFFFMFDNLLTQVEGIILFLSLVFFGFYLFYKTKKEGASAIDLDVEFDGTAKSDKNDNLKNIGLIVLGAVGLLFGAEWMLDGAVSIANKWGVSERVIGITIIAFGTSLPELVTSIVAIYRKQDDISVGNLIGSNLFNTLGILGITAIVKPINVSQEIINFDVIAMIFVSIIIFPMMLHKRSLGKIKGAILVSLYLSYVFYLFYYK
jgi:cation:H+ antiporter